jgi:hypothetical protein
MSKNFHHNNQFAFYVSSDIYRSGLLYLRVGDTTLGLMKANRQRLRAIRFSIALRRKISSTCLSK